MNAHLFALIGLAWGGAIALMLVVWAIALTPRRREERAIEREELRRRMQEIDYES